MSEFKRFEIGKAIERSTPDEEMIAATRDYYEDMLKQARFSLKNREMILFGVEKILQEIKGEKETEDKLEEVERGIQMIMNYRAVLASYNPNVEWKPEEMEDRLKKQKESLEMLLGIELEPEDESASRKNIQ